MSKVDNVTKTRWNDQLDYQRLPTWEDCSKIIIRRCQSLEVNESRSIKHENSHNKNRNFHNNDRKPHIKSSFAASIENDFKCPFCKTNSHFLNSCNSFGNLMVGQRFDFVKENALCINCLKKGHTVSSCRAMNCKICKRPHHSLLHRNTNNPFNKNNNNNGNASSNVCQNDNSASVSVCQIENSKNSNQINETPSFNKATTLKISSNKDVVILATAVIEIKDKFGNFQPVRALLDSGSQVNFVTEETASRLKIHREHEGLNLIGIGEVETSTKQKISTIIKSRINETKFDIDLFVMKSISGYQPEANISTKEWNIPKNLPLADPHFNKRSKIDLLVGADVFFQLLSRGQVKLDESLPTLHKTCFGWIVSGKYSPLRNPNSKLNYYCNLVEQNLNVDMEALDKIVEKFWTIEEVVNEKPHYTDEQKACENHFIKNVQILPNNRIEVALPFKKDGSLLGLSYETAKRRFLSLERRLEKTPEIKLLYIEFMKEYLELNHMSPTNNKIPKDSHYFIPHQVVVRPQSTSTKLRVVFDASSRTSSNVSLNDILMVGPTIQADLYITLLRFRCRKYAFTADITKMYRQILIREIDRNYQLILWRENPNMEIQIYKLNTVTYGTSPAPFLAIRCLSYLSDLFKEKYPRGAKILKTDFYVDDLMSGAHTLEEMEIIRTEVVAILDSAGLILAKWFSNNINFVNTEAGEKSLEFNNEDTTKALGITWNTKDDVLKFKIDKEFANLKATKRNVCTVI